MPRKYIARFSQGIPFQGCIPCISHATTDLLQAEAEAAEDLAARLAATEETRRQERLRAAEELAKAADTSTGRGGENLADELMSGVRMRCFFGYSV